MGRSKDKYSVLILTDFTSPWRCNGWGPEKNADSTDTTDSHQCTVRIGDSQNGSINVT